eukprot:scaffold195885_cov27-Tisochrysis_lutea.AAC.3
MKPSSCLGKSNGSERPDATTDAARLTRESSNLVITGPSIPRPKPPRLCREELMQESSSTISASDATWLPKDSSMRKRMRSITAPHFAVPKTATPRPLRLEARARSCALLGVHLNGQPAGVRDRRWRGGAHWHGRDEQLQASNKYYEHLGGQCSCQVLLRHISSRGED